MSSQSNRKLVFMEKVNHRFKRICGTRQASGLTNCLNHIVEGVPDTVRAEVDNADHVISAISRYKPEKVVFEALWACEETIKRVRKAYPKVEIYIHMHSNVPFLATEGHAFMSLKVYRDLDCGFIWNCSKAYSSMSWISDSYLLPNLYMHSFYEIHKHADEYLDVACYGSLREMKNQTIQAIAGMMAADMLGKKLRFNMNLGRDEGGSSVRSSLKGLFCLNPKHELINRPWMDQKEFVQHLRGMDIGLQVSMSETFNLVAADYVAAGIPIVVSDEITWAHYDCIAPCGDAYTIATRMIESLKNNRIKENRLSLQEHNEDAARRWSEFVEA